MKTKLILILTASIVTLKARTNKSFDADWYERQNAEINAERRHKEDKQEREYKEQQQWIDKYQRESTAKKAQETAGREAAENARRLEKIQQKLEELEGGKPWSPKR